MSQDYNSRLSMEFTNSLFREDGINWSPTNADIDMGMLAVNEAFPDVMFDASEGPSSVHSDHNSYYSGAYDSQNVDPLGGPPGEFIQTVMSAMDVPMDMDSDANDLNFDSLDGTLHPLTPQPQGMASSVAEWYDNDL